MAIATARRSSGSSLRPLRLVGTGSLEDRDLFSELEVFRNDLEQRRDERWPHELPVGPKRVDCSNVVALRARIAPQNVGNRSPVR